MRRGPSPYFAPTIREFFNQSWTRKDGERIHRCEGSHCYAAEDWARHFEQILLTPNETLLSTNLNLEVIGRTALQTKIKLIFRIEGWREAPRGKSLRTRSSPSSTGRRRRYPSTSSSMAVSFPPPSSPPTRSALDPTEPGNEPPEHPRPQPPSLALVLVQPVPPRRGSGEVLAARRRRRRRPPRRCRRCCRQS